VHDLLEDRKNIEEEYKIFVLPFLMRNKELAERYTAKSFSYSQWVKLPSVGVYNFTELTKTFFGDFSHWVVQKQPENF